MYVFPEGLRRFPCHPEGTADAKKPCIKGWQKAATADAQQIAEWEHQFPGCLWGVPTGEANDLFVIDIDPKAKGWLKEKLSDGSLTPGYSHRTRRGWHLVYRHTPEGRNSASKIAAGVDTRGRGGYVIWWPAVLAADAGGNGTAVVGDLDRRGPPPVWAVTGEPVDAPHPHGRAPARAAARMEVPGNTGTPLPAELAAPDLSMEAGVFSPWSMERCFEALAWITVDDGDYDKWREVTWGLRSALIEIGEDNDESFDRYHVWSAALPGHTECTCRRVWDDHDPARGLGPGTFYHYAKQAAAPLSFRETANIGQVIQAENEAAQAAEVAAKAELLQVAQLRSIGEICDEWVWIERQKCWWHLNGRYTLDKEAWDAAYANQRTPPMSVIGTDGQPTIKDGKPLKSDWMLQRTVVPVVTRYLDFDYAPGSPTVLRSGGGLSPKLNKWKSPGIEPVEPPDAFKELWKKYLTGMVQPGEQEGWDYILDTMACLVQRPAFKPPVSLLIVGSPGTGKSTLFEDIMEVLVGEHNFITASTQNLESQFNSLYLERKVVSIPEMKDLSRASANRLKSLITSSRLTINEKYTKEYQVVNAAMIVATSNYDAPVPVELGDRRWITVRTAGKQPEKGTPRQKMFALLHGALKKPTTQAWIHWLFRARLLDKWDPYSVPTTMTKSRMVEESLFPWQQDLIEMVRDKVGVFGQPWPDSHGWIPFEAIMAQTIEQCSGAGKTTRRQIGKFLSSRLMRGVSRRLKHGTMRDVKVWKFGEEAESEVE